MIVEKNPVFPTFHSFSVKSIAEYEASQFPLESNARHVTFLV
jgi:hypothetical protein